MPEPNPYYTPGKITIQPDLLETVHQEGLQLAETLSPLPDGVTAFVINHAAAINTKLTGRLRLELAESIGEPPYIPSDALRVGQGILHLIEDTNANAVQLEVDGIIIAEDFNMGFPGRPRDGGPETKPTQ
jgi:hypothetical protein